MTRDQILLRPQYDACGITNARVKSPAAQADCLPETLCVYFYDVPALYSKYERANDQSFSYTR